MRQIQVGTDGNENLYFHGNKEISLFLELKNIKFQWPYPKIECYLKP